MTTYCTFYADGYCILNPLNQVNFRQNQPNFLYVCTCVLYPFAQKTQKKLEAVWRLTAASALTRNSPIIEPQGTASSQF